MINEVDNNSSLNQMSDLEHDKNQLEMMRYRENRLSYNIGILGIFASLFACFICLNSTNPITVVIVAKVMLNIVILLGGFLCIEKAKAYSKGGSIALIVFGGFCFARIFWIPLQLIRYFAQYQDFLNGKSTDQTYLDYLGKTVTAAYEKSGDSFRWLPASGTFRGIFAIVLLLIAAATFIAAGVIGYIRSKKLNTYLDSLKVNE
jgi:hypothetical protein